MEQNNIPTQFPNKLKLIRNSCIGTTINLDITNVNNNAPTENKLPSIIFDNNNDFDNDYCFKSPPFKRTKLFHPNISDPNTSAFSLTSTPNRKKQKKQINSSSNAKNVFNYDANK